MKRVNSDFFNSYRSVKYKWRTIDVKVVVSILLALFFSSQLRSQVTIGLDKQAVQGALLQLKMQEVSNAASNSQKGLMLPRVSLNSTSSTSGNVNQKLRTSLGLPTTVTTDALVHTGLMIYNVATNNSVSTNAPFGERKICPGVYVWNGSVWMRMMHEECK